MGEEPGEFPRVRRRIPDTKSRTAETGQEATFEQAVEIQDAIKFLLTQLPSRSKQGSDKSIQSPPAQAVGDLLPGKQQHLVDRGTE